MTSGVSTPVGVLRRKCGSLLVKRTTHEIIFNGKGPKEKKDFVSKMTAYENGNENENGKRKEHIP